MSGSGGVHKTADSETVLVSDSDRMCRRICRVYGQRVFVMPMFGLDESLTVSLLPKSVTTPIAVSIAEPAGGMVPITVWL